MQRLLKVIISFSNYTDANFGLKAKHIIDSVTANATTFPTPSPTLAILGTQYTACNTALAAADGGSELQVATKDATRLTLSNSLKTLAIYVTAQAGTDPVKLAHSGYDLTSGETSPTEPHPAPAELAQSPQAGTRVYMWQYIATPPTGPMPPDASPWLWAFSTKAKTTIAGLASGQAYYFRAA